MIVYFSATGNSKHVAHKIAMEIDDWARPIEELKLEKHVEARAGGVFGIVCPTYFCGIPVIMEEFLKKVKMFVGEDCYFFFVSTYGGNSGMSADMVEEILNERGLKIDAKYGVKMPDTWAPIIDLNDKSKIAAINSDADKNILRIAEQIKNREKGNFIKNKKSRFFSKFNYRVYDRMRETKNFIVTDACTGCKLCIKRCPIKVIEMVNDRPSWITDQCVMCLGCYHRCPMNAIQYGSSTKGHGQYIHPNDLDETDKA